MKNILRKLVTDNELAFDEIEYAVDSIAHEEASEAQIAAFITALTTKGVSKEEFYALAKSMRKYARRVETGKYIVDSCGTGADGAGTINISTCAAIVANAAGVNIVKQTNSSITSCCGSTDFLHTLGIEIAQTPEKALEQFEKNSITFVHSPYFNDFARINNPIRQQLGFKTVFNYLGPLINASFPQAQLLGCSSNEMLENMAYALQKLGTERALVVNGLEPNVDEISICSKTRVLELKDGKIEEYFISPEDFGMQCADLSQIQGGSGADNTRIFREILNHSTIQPLDHSTAAIDVISLNAGAMIYLSGQTPTIFEGVKMAQKAIESGLAAHKLDLIMKKCYSEMNSESGSLRAC